jgi:hypothetical protein
MDFMLADLGPVPPGSSLVFTYGPTFPVYLSWALSAISLVAMLTWMVWPRWWRRVGGRVARWLVGARDRATSRFAWSEDEG